MPESSGADFFDQLFARIEDDTFLISDWFKHTPNEVLAKNFGAPASLFGHTPDPSERYIFPAPVPTGLLAGHVGFEPANPSASYLIGFA
jgi:oxalate decarboxylase